MCKRKFHSLLLSYCLIFFHVFMFSISLCFHVALRQLLCFFLYIWPALINTTLVWFGFRLLIGKDFNFNFNSFLKINFMKHKIYDWKHFSLSCIPSPFLSHVHCDIPVNNYCLWTSCEPTLIHFFNHTSFSS